MLDSVAQRKRHVVQDHASVGSNPIGVTKMKETYRSPWFNLHGYLACTVKYEDGSKRTVLQHREIMEDHLGRRLNSNTFVHHKDRNKRNNDLDNLEVRSRSSHSKIHSREIEYAELVCVSCGQVFVREAKEERARIKKGRSGPFCNKSCAGRFTRGVQIANGMSNLRKAGVAQQAEATDLESVG